MDLSYHIEIEDGIATFTIDRPEMRNAVNYDCHGRDWNNFLNQIEDNPDVAFAVITGAGDRAFCSGGDLSEFHALRTADEAFPMLSGMAEAIIQDCNAADACHCTCQRRGCRWWL